MREDSFSFSWISVVMTLFVLCVLLSFLVLMATIVLAQDYQVSWQGRLGVTTGDLRVTINDSSNNDVIFDHTFIDAVGLLATGTYGFDLSTKSDQLIYGKNYTVCFYLDNADFVMTQFGCHFWISPVGKINDSSINVSWSHNVSVLNESLSRKLGNSSDAAFRNLFVGSEPESILNSNFLMSGDDLFVNGSLGVKGNTYVDGSLFILGDTFTTNINITVMNATEGIFCNQVTGDCVNLSNGNINLSGGISCGNIRGGSDPDFCADDASNSSLGTLNTSLSLKISNYTSASLVTLNLTGFIVPRNRGLSFQDVVLYLPANNDSLDLSGYGHDGDRYGDELYKDGRFGSAFAFDGEDDALVVPGQDFRFVGDGWTVAFWFRIENSTVLSDKSATEKWDGSGNNAYPWAVRFLNSSGNQSVSFAVYNGSCNPGISYTFLDEDIAYEWHHVVGVVDKNASNISLYVDGVLRNNLVNWCINSSVLDYGRNITVGGRSSSGGQNQKFDGSIDEFLVFNRSLEEYEVRSLYESNVEFVAGEAYLLRSDNTYCRSDGQNCLSSLGGIRNATDASLSSLNVNGNVSLGGTTSGDITLIIDTDPFNSPLLENSNPSLVFRQDGGSVNTTMGFFNDNSFRILSNNDMWFGTFASQRILGIDVGRNVVTVGAIGSDPSQKFTVEGNTNLSGNVNVTGNLLLMGNINFSGSGGISCGNIRGGSDPDFCADDSSGSSGTDTYVNATGDTMNGSLTLQDGVTIRNQNNDLSIKFSGGDIVVKLG